MPHTHRQPNQPEQHRLPAATSLAALGGAAVVLLFGFLVGRLTESVAGMPGGVAGLWWLVLLPVVVVVEATLVTVHRAVRRQPRADDRSEQFTLIQSQLSQRTEQVRDLAEREVFSEPQPAATTTSAASVGGNLGSALDLFLRETTKAEASSSGKIVHSR